jgi:hypothetical protein
MARPPLRFGVPKSRKSNSWPQTTAQSRPTHPGIPDRGRGSAAKGGGQGQPVGPPRCDHDPRGLPRAAELVDLRWDQVVFRTGTLHVRRVKQGTPSTHPILGDELRALRRLQREQVPKSPFVFNSERGASFSPPGFARMIERAGAHPTCCAMLAATRWLTKGTIPEHYRRILGTRIFSTRCATPS